MTIAPNHKAALTTLGMLTLALAACANSDSFDDSSAATSESTTSGVDSLLAALRIEQPALEFSADATLGNGRYALIVLADEYAAEPAWNLKSDDVLARLSKTLSSALAIPAANTLVLRGDKATADAVANALTTTLAARMSGTGNLLLVYWFGHGVTRSQPKEEVVLFTHYTKRQGDQFEKVLTHAELGLHISMLRDALEKKGGDMRVVTVIDACRVRLLPPLGPAKIYGVSDADIFSSKAGQFAEATVFTEAFCSAVEREHQAGRDVELGAVFEVMKQDTLARTNHQQEPVLVQAQTRLTLRTTGNLRLRVAAVDARTKTPIRATIKLNDRELAAPAVFEGLAPGEFFLQVSAPGYFWRAETIRLSEQENGRTLNVSLSPEFVAVVGRINNSAQTRVVVELDAATHPDHFRPDTHQRQTEVLGNGPFRLLLPVLPLSAQVRIRLDGRQLALTRLSQAAIRFADVPIGSTPAPQTHRVQVVDLGSFDIGELARPTTVEQLGEGLQVGELLFPTLTFNDVGMKTQYEQAIEFARTGKPTDLDTARRLLTGLIKANAVTTPDGAKQLATLNEQIVIQYLIRRYDGAGADRATLAAVIDDLESALTAGVIVEFAPRAKTQLVRWLNTRATQLAADAPDAAITDLKRALKHADVEQATWLRRQMERVYVETAQDVLGAAFKSDDWATAERWIEQGLAEFPSSSGLTQMRQTLTREKMPSATRQMLADADREFAAGEFEAAEEHYTNALASLNPSYRDHVNQQLAALAKLLFAKFIKTAGERHRAGDLSAALRAYLKAFPYQPAAVAPVLEDPAFKTSALDAVWSPGRKLVGEWTTLQRALEHTDIERVFLLNRFIDAHSDSSFIAQARAEVAAAVKWADNKTAYENMGASLFGEGLKQQQAGQPKNAATTYSKAIDWNPKHIGAFINRGNIRYLANDFDLAVANYSQALTIDPNYLLALTNRGQAYLYLGRYAEAEVDFNRALAVQPTYAPARLGLGDVTRLQGQFARAREIFDQAIAADATNAEAYLGRGLLNVQQSQFDAALTDFRQAVRLQPSNWRAWRQIALLVSDTASKREAWTKVRELASSPERRAEAEAALNALPR